MARAPPMASSRSRPAVSPPAREPTTTRSPKPSAAMSSSIVRFIASPPPFAASVRSGQRLGVPQRDRGPVDRQRAGATLRAEQLQTQFLVGVALAEQAAPELVRIGRALWRLAPALRVPQWNAGAGQLDVAVGSANHDHGGRVHRAGKCLTDAGLHRGFLLSTCSWGSHPGVRRDAWVVSG